jgi:hypothetical protein
MLIRIPLADNELAERFLPKVGVTGRVWRIDCALANAKGAIVVDMPIRARHRPTGGSVCLFDGNGGSR